MQGTDQEDQMRKHCTVGGEMGRDGEQEVSWKTTKSWKRDGESHPSGRSDVLEGGQPVAQVVCCDGQQAPSAEVGR